MLNNHIILFLVICGILIPRVASTVESERTDDTHMLRCYSVGNYDEILESSAERLYYGERLSPLGEELLLRSMHKTRKFDKILVYERKFGVKDEFTVASRVLIAWAAYCDRQFNLGSSYSDGIDISTVSDREIRKLYFFTQSIRSREAGDYSNALSHMLAAKNEGDLNSSEEFILAYYHAFNGDNDKSLAAIIRSSRKLNAADLPSFVAALADESHAPLYTDPNFVDVYILTADRVQTRYKSFLEAVDLEKAVDDEEMRLLRNTITDLGVRIYDANQAAGKHELAQMAFNAFSPLDKK